MDLFSALADPTRRTIVELLARHGPLAATAIYAHFPVSHSAISQHLKLLRQAQVVVMEKQAQQRLYQLNPDALVALEAWAKHMTRLWQGRFDVLERVLAEEQQQVVLHELEKSSSMTTQMHQNQSQEVTITRLFAAPRELVFKAWTDPRLVAQWWGPHHFTTQVHTLDARPGGSFHFDMRGPDGVVYPSEGVFEEVIEPERLVLTLSGFADEAGHPQLETRTTVTFAELGGQTILTMHTMVVNSAPAVGAALADMEEGWNQALDRLAEALAKN